MLSGRQRSLIGNKMIYNSSVVDKKAKISKNLKIGNNVKIGGGSGVVKNIPNNSKVMGYPAKDIKKFIMENK